LKNFIFEYRRTWKSCCDVKFQLTKTQFITNDSGKKLAVILPISKYRKMLEELEELDDIKAYDA